MIKFLIEASFAFLFFLNSFPSRAMGNSDDFIVVVNSSVKESSLTKADVQQILLTNQTTWKDSKKIVIITLPPGSDQAELISKEFLNMTSIQAKKHWLTKVFGGTIAAVPMNADTPDEVVDLVSKTPGALAVLPKDTKPGKAKILSIK